MDSLLRVALVLFTVQMWYWANKGDVCRTIYNGCGVLAVIIIIATGLLIRMM